MTVINGYCTRAELLRAIASGDSSLQPDVLDDEVIDDLITDASRAVDNHCARQFYAEARTLYLDAPVATLSRALYFPCDVLSVQGASDGTGASIASSQYYLWPRNAQAYAAIVLTESSTASWAPASSGDSEGVITIAASVGYCNRAASSASATGSNLQVIAATRRATMLIAADLYRKRFGLAAEAVQVVAGGVIVSPQGIPKDAAALLEPYRRIV